MNSYNKKDAIEKIQKLRKYGLPNILNIGDNIRIAYTFSTYNGCLICVDNNGNIMNKKEMQKVVDYFTYSIKNIDEQSIVDAQIEFLLEAINDYNKPIKSEAKKTKKGYVYLIKGENGRYKIGFSIDPKRRNKELCLSSSEKHTLIHSFYRIDPYLAEQELHKKFYSKRTHTEWFNLSIKDVSFIKGLKDEI